MAGSVYLGSIMQEATNVSECTTEGTFWLVMLQHEAGNVTASEVTKEKVAQIAIPKKGQRTVIDTVKFGYTINKEVGKILPHFVKVCEEFQPLYAKQCPLKLAGVSLPNETVASRSFRKLLQKHAAASEAPVNLDTFKLQDLLASLEAEGSTICKLK